MEILVERKDAINMALSPMNNQNGCGGRLAANRSTSRHNHQIVTGLLILGIVYNSDEHTKSSQFSR